MRDFLGRLLALPLVLSLALVLLTAAACGGSDQTRLGGGSGNPSSGASSGNPFSGAGSGVSTGAPSGASGGSTQGGGSGSTSGAPGSPIDGGAEAAASGPDGDTNAVEASSDSDPSSTTEPPETGVIDAADERDVRDGSRPATCPPVADGKYYVDPSAGLDAPSSTGSRDCPLRTLTRAVVLVSASRAGLDASSLVAATLTIVNDTAPTTVGDTYGESFPITPPANVTITALDTTKNTPVFVQTSTFLDGYFELVHPGVHLSHLVLQGGNVVRHAVDIAFSATGASLDHIQVSDFGLQGINSGASMVTIGPGVVVTRGGVGGLQFTGGSMILLGGQGAEHTSITGNRFGGLWLHGAGEVKVAGIDIDPNHPDVSDIDTDGNGAAGVMFDAALEPPGTEIVTIRGLHSTGSTVGIRANGPSTTILSVRGSYLADNTQSAIVLSSTTFNSAGPSTFDFGAPGGADGRNVFESPKQAATVNTQGAICLSSSGHVLAAGNVFGATDCSVSGTLTYSATCTGQVDVGGVALGGSSSIDVSHCQ